MTVPPDRLAGLAEARPLVMGILNTTPDSFSDGGSWGTVDRAVAHAETMLADGADIIDVGGESSRPGAEPVDPAEEMRRVLPVIERLADRCVISIDTAKPEVADAALARGAHILNDITGSLESVAGHHAAGWIAMHMQGEPRSMQTNPTYDDVVAEVASFLLDARRRGDAAGVGRLWIDPGIGFGKTTEHNLRLLRELRSIVGLGTDVLVGVSRKRFIGLIHAYADVADTDEGARQDELAPTPPNDRLEASVFLAAWSWMCGARVVRCHDVAPTVAVARRLAT